MRVVVFECELTGYRPMALHCVKLLVNCEKLKSWHEKGMYLYKNQDGKGEAPVDIAIKHGSLKMAEVFITAHESPAAW